MNGTNGVAETFSRREPISGSLVHSTENGFTLLVGTFTSPELYTLQFKAPARVAPQASSAALPTSHTPTGALTVSHKSPAAGGHSWLSLSASHNHLYTTVWASPPLVAAYALHPHTKVPTLLNTARIASTSGYVAPTRCGTHLLSVGGPSGEVFRLRASDGGFDVSNATATAAADSTAAAPGQAVQTLAFRTPAELNDGRRDGVAHGDFNGLRHGAHSVDLSPDGRIAYVADIGHNCIWTYIVEKDVGGSTGVVLTRRTKHPAPRAVDGPRHCWPHPNGRVVYCVQEHSGMVDAFSVAGGNGAGVVLTHMHGFSLLPAGKAAGEFWADEVRTSNLPGPDGQQQQPTRWLYASTRGLEQGTKGYVAVFELDAEGAIRGPAVGIYETRTSGGLANAVEPAPTALYKQLGADWNGEEFLALTDSQEGWVVVLGWDGKRFREVAAVQLEGAKAATAVWV